MAGEGISRRAFLSGALATGIGGTLVACGRGSDGSDADRSGPAPRSPNAVPFRGEHQSAITTPAPAAAILVALDAVAPTTDRLARGMRAVSDEVRRLSAEGHGPSAAASAIVGVGASLFDDRYGLAPSRPRELTAMPRFPNDRIDESRTHGDVLLTISADDSEAAERARVAVLGAADSAFAPRWMLDGANHVPDGAEHARNPLGFLDGTSNPDPDDEAAMRLFVWVRERDDEPAWATGGSYQVVRVTRTNVSEWDRLDVGDQEAIIGRRKQSGAPLGGGSVDDVPEYSDDPDGEVTPLDAHIRLANPRDSNIEYDSILRRGFSYDHGLDDSGPPERGLAFVCFQRSFEKGFQAIQRRLVGEPLERFTQAVGGGYYFALPGPLDEADWLGRSLLESV